MLLSNLAKQSLTKDFHIYIRRKHTFFVHSWNKIFQIMGQMSAQLNSFAATLENISKLSFNDDIISWPLSHMQLGSIHIRLNRSCWQTAHDDSGKERKKGNIMHSTKWIANKKASVCSFDLVCQWMANIFHHRRQIASQCFIFHRCCCYHTGTQTML